MLRFIVADQKSTAARVAHYLQSHHVPLGMGHYPMSFTGMHDLAISFLVSQLIDCQRQDITTLEQVVADTSADRAGKPWPKKRWGCPGAPGSARRSWPPESPVRRPPRPADRSGASAMLFDTHAHLDQEDFDADRAEVVERARLAGVERIVAVGTTAQASAKCIELARQFPGVLAAAGIQPNYTAQAEPGDWDQIVALANDPRVVGIGETGLDRYWDYSPLALQQDYFDRHLRLSQLLAKPFIVHTRESDADVLAMLREARGAARCWA